jgi:hypothetical protein
VTVRITASAATGAGPVNPQHEAIDDPVWRGNCADTDIVVASVKAYVAALNRMLAAVELGVVSQGENVAREGARV